MASKKLTSKSVNKSTAKNIRTTGKQLRQLSKALQRDADSRQLRAIEKLLDEDFTSLSAAKRELRRNTQQVKRTSKAALKAFKSLTNVFKDAFTTPSKSKASKPKRTPASKSVSGKQKTVSSSRPPRQKSVSKSKPPASPVSSPPRKSKGNKGRSKKSVAQAPPVKNQPTAKPAKKQAKKFTSRSPLRRKKGEDTLTYFDRLESYGNGPDSLLNPGERWEFTYGKGKSRRLYGSFQMIVNKMNSYELTQGLENGTIDPLEDDIENKLLDSIKITRTDIAPLARAQENEARLKLRENERKQIQREGRRNVVNAGIQEPSIFGGSVDIVAQQNRIIANLLAENAKLKGEKNEATGKAKRKRVGKSGAAKKAASKRKGK